MYKVAFLKVRHLLAAATLALAASGASANNIAENITAPGGTTAFGAVHTDNVDFTDVFTFTVSGPVKGSASLFTVGGGFNNIDFLSVDLNGIALTLFSPNAGFSETAFTLADLDLLGPVILTVSGRSGAGTGGNAAYSGNLNVREAVTVPVPATLALFGLGLVGLGWSRRQQA